MKRKLSIVAKALGIASVSSTLAFLNLVPLPALAINRVPDGDCQARTDFFKLWNNTTIAGGVCFANSGWATNLNIYNVYEITSGKNNGFVVDSSGNYYPFYGYKFCQNADFRFNPPIKDVVAVYIDPHPTC